jgi:hypothetical protein
MYWGLTIWNYIHLALYKFGIIYTPKVCFKRGILRHVTPVTGTATSFLGGGEVLWALQTPHSTNTVLLLTYY